MTNDNDDDLNGRIVVHQPVIVTNESAETEPGILVLIRLTNIPDEDVMLAIRVQVGGRND